eukprot:scaffold20154_cov17-Tisochrysis_lutea.AAC.2
MQRKPVTDKERREGVGYAHGDTLYVVEQAPVSFIPFVLVVMAVVLGAVWCGRGEVSEQGSSKVTLLCTLLPLIDVSGPPVLALGPCDPTQPYRCIWLQVRQGVKGSNPPENDPGVPVALFLRDAMTRWKQQTGHKRCNPWAAQNGMRFRAEAVPSWKDEKNQLKR